MENPATQAAARKVPVANLRLFAIIGGCLAIGIVAFYAGHLHGSS